MSVNQGVFETYMTPRADKGRSWQQSYGPVSNGDRLFTISKYTCFLDALWLGLLYLVIKYFL